MKLRLVPSKFVLMALIPVLATAVAVAQGHGNDQNDNHDQGHHDNGNHGDNGNHNGPPQNFQFHDQDRNQFQGHYQKDVRKWQKHPQGRPHFERGQRVPDGYRFQPVPRSYYATPPPPGYQYGYYNGYIVAYSPTTRVIADVIDLVGAATSR